jgi:hypothetical protein
MNSKAKKVIQMTSKKEVVNQRIIDRFDFKSFQRFNQLGLATRIGLLKKIGGSGGKITCRFSKCNKTYSR